MSTYHLFESQHAAGICPLARIRPLRPANSRPPAIPRPHITQAVEVFVVLSGNRQVFAIEIVALGPKRL